MKLHIAVLPGDGIGPEVIKQALKALRAVAERFDHVFIFKEAPIGATAIQSYQNPLPEHTLDICRNSDAILLGTIGHPDYETDPDIASRPEDGLLRLRKELNLYANVRPVKAYEALFDKAPLRKRIIRNTDVLIYRELTGGIYYGAHTRDESQKKASDLCEYTSEEIERIAHRAFRMARQRKNKVTLIDKANVLETSRLWRRTVSALAPQYPEVFLNYMYVDTAAMQLVVNPTQFDVILTENLFGDIISDEASAISGSIGMLASASVGEKYSVFEPVHNSYPKATGLNIANPIAAILSAALLLEHLELLDEAEAIREAVDKTLTLQLTTPDLNPKKPFTTEKVGDFISDYIVDPHDENINYYNIYMGQSTII